MEKETLYANNFNIFTNTKYDEVCLTFSQVVPYFEDFDYSKPVEKGIGSSSTIFLNSTLALELASEIARVLGMQLSATDTDKDEEAVLDHVE